MTGKFHDFECAIMNLYAPNDGIERRQLWEEIIQLMGSYQIPWCIGGDLVWLNQ